MSVGVAGRIFAACIAAVAWIGLIVQFAELYRAHSAVMSLWMMFAFFTITTNVLVAIVFSCIALDRGMLRADWIVGGTTLSILLVGVVNALLLWGLLELSGGSALVDRLLHVMTPACALLFWIVFARKGGLAWRDPLRWAIYPLTYFAYAIARGTATGRYAYPFLNVLTLGWSRTALNAFYIAVAFMVCGYAMVWIDRRMGSRGRPVPAI
ncbi:MAG TPA: Pr6Pr family membrane protein [Acidobacteriaceae bacterium]|jgi:hypothetical protein